jgi:acyl-CoA reductase-like NAD-dependent aldehyde dehydrogenase
MKLHPWESIDRSTGQPVVRFPSDTSRAEVDRFIADAGLKAADWSRLSVGPTGRIGGKRVQLWELPAAKADTGF